MSGHAVGSGQLPPGHRQAAAAVFTSVASSVPAARAWVAQQLARLGVDPDTSERVQLLVSEIAANAVRHTTSTRFGVRISASPHLEAAVHDDDPAGQPRLTRPGPEPTHGRGLAIVDALADNWGTRRTPTGKWVWFRVSSHPASRLAGAPPGQDPE